MKVQLAIIQAVQAMQKQQTRHRYARLVGADALLVCTGALLVGASSQFWIEGGREILNSRAKQEQAIARKMMAEAKTMEVKVERLLAEAKTTGAGSG